MPKHILEKNHMCVDAFILRYSMSHESFDVARRHICLRGFY
jgi:hypothetical protein